MKRVLAVIFCLLILMPVLAQELQAAEAGTITITVTIAEVEIIQATVEFQPETIRRGFRNIQCYIELPAPYKVEDIDVNTVKLTEVNGTPIEPSLKTVGPSKIGDFDKDGIPDLRVWFDIQSLTPLLKAGENSLTAAGNMKDGKRFQGTGTLRLRK